MLTFFSRVSPEAAAAAVEKTARENPPLPPRKLPRTVSGKERTALWRKRKNDTESASSSGTGPASPAGSSPVKARTTSAPSLDPFFDARSATSSSGAPHTAAPDVPLHGAPDARDSEKPPSKSASPGGEKPPAGGAHAGGAPRAPPQGSAQDASEKPTTQREQPLGGGIAGRGKGIARGRPGGSRMISSNEKAVILTFVKEHGGSGVNLDFGNVARVLRESKSTRDDVRPRATRTKCTPRYPHPLSNRHPTAPPQFGPGTSGLPNGITQKRVKQIFVAAEKAAEASKVANRPPFLP